MRVAFVLLVCLCLLSFVSHVEAQDARLAAVPPSLMLHAEHTDPAFLEPLLDGLLAEGYTATTYQEWSARLLAGEPILKPVIISFDDLTAVDSINNIDLFRRAYQALRVRSMKAVFVLITEPVAIFADGSHVIQTQQDAEKWQELAVWVENGMEIATHSNSHTNLNRMDTGPRRDFTTAMYYAEIVRSVNIIEKELERNGLCYEVTTFVTPFGSGYSYGLTSPALHPGVIKFSRAAGIVLVIGIAGGRTPLVLDELANAGHSVQYIGRVGPHETNGLPDVWGTISYLNDWWEAYRLYQ